MKLTPKQEHFAQVYVATSNASEAYRQAYDVKPATTEATIWPAASRALKNSKVAARVAELQASARERNQVTVDTLTAELDDALKVAKENATAAAMVSATMAKAKLYGLDKVKGPRDTEDDKVIRVIFET